MPPTGEENPQLRPRGPRGPRLYHKKSRAGCMRCKQRRVKCDESRPSCGGCSRHVVKCVYPNHAAAPSTSPTPTPSSSSSTRARRNAVAARLDLSAVDGLVPLPAAIKISPPTTDNSVDNSPSSQGHSTRASYQKSSTSPMLDQIDSAPPESNLDLPETRERRIWELRLLHNSLTAAKPFSTPQSTTVMHLWSIDVPNMALKEGRDAILYGILAHSALNMWTRSTDPKEREELIRLQQTYLGMMLQEQRRDVVNLDPSNADYLCFSSLKILTHALALIQTLPLEPWEPPIDWLQMGMGAGAVFRNTWPLVETNEGTTKILTFLRSPPLLQDPLDTIYSDHSDLDWILETPPALDARADAELEDEETLSVYHKVLAYTCSVQRAKDRREPDFAICRRLGGFAVWVPCEFTQFLIERRPRAMVALAHFMSCFLDIQHVWLIGKAGERQIRGIHKNLPLEWTYKLDKLFSMFSSSEESPRPATGGFGSLM
ncbi:hypothetical protein BJ170DRAFT_78534 [Xylariales sp. AK1849]|nr:hypothetical protein BJ170DRAFT_78534 [Xylariales sp. AK1849]